MTEKELQTIKENNRKFIKNQKNKRYGVSEKNGEPVYAIEFKNQEQAEEWLKTEEYDFRSREIFETLDDLCNAYPDYYDAETINDVLKKY